MDVKRRQQVLLAVLLAVLAIAAYVEWPRATGAQPAPGGRDAGAKTGGSAATATTEAPDVHLETLEAQRPTPGASDRDLFKFKPKYVPPPAPSAPPPVVPAGPPPPPPVPAIPLKFIGVLEGQGRQRTAILTDGHGSPVYGKEGEAVLGQYKILRIGAESIEMEHLDGRGRQTIRLSGS